MIERKIDVLAASFIVMAALCSVAMIWPLGAAAEPVTVAPAPTPVDTPPPYSAYRNVAIGMSMADVRAKVGAPKERSDQQDAFVFSGNESAQIFYDSAKAVSAIMITYGGKLTAAPTPKAVFGEDVEAKPDGGIFKMVRYPTAGFWISYTKTAGDDPLIIIAIQKIM